MVFSKHILVVILQGALIILPLLVQPQQFSDFISIDCGISEDSSYIDGATGIRYVSDANFTEGGENNNISPAYKEQINEQQLWNLRSFPEETRNCYTLKPAGGKGSKYLIRARFLYGNYDNQDRLPTFNLHLGVDLWDTVNISDALTTEDKEIIYVLSSDQIHVCLVNTNNGMPFISALELRPLDNNIYETERGSFLKLYDRNYFSSATNQEKIRYKDDVYDRLWSLESNLGNWIQLDTPLIKENSISNNVYMLPFTIMSRAVTVNQSGEMGISCYSLSTTSSYYFYMHFVELIDLRTDERREFNIYINDQEYLNESVAPQYLSDLTVYSASGIMPDSEGTITIWMNKTKSSTLPPFINALEIYTIEGILEKETDQTDVEAISIIKLAYKLKRNWQGDPCSPRAYRWDGLNCSSDANPLRRIVYLNLSSSGLDGEIAPSLVNLTMLKYSDLSNNNLKGQVPEFLAKLKLLEVLNLKGNNFTGSIPNALSERSKNGLSLSIDTNQSSTPYCSSGSCGGKKNFVVPLVASLGTGMVLFVLTIATVLWTRKRRKQREATDIKVDMEDSNEDDRSFVAKKQRFTHSEIQRITDNFKRVLGEGGFGKVYHGYLNGIEVAVKMLSPSSIQGQRQFHAELKLLLRVHHKNLITFLGYCNEGTNIGLIYEFMAMGNLRSHLSGSSQKILSWEDRLKIAIDASQGLEYLHSGCKPPLVHRDVKSTNILLNEKFQAKLGDFGLSKMIPNESGKHRWSYTDTSTSLSTNVAGTPGYLDPEYCESMQLNEKSDIYSFGVVLLETITARPVFAKIGESNHIIEWVGSMLANGDIRTILDPRLKGCNLDINTVWKALEIAMACVSKTSTNRPTMGRVAVELKECLTTELAGKDGHAGAESKDSAEMIPLNSIISEQSLPIAR